MIFKFLKVTQQRTGGVVGNLGFCCKFIALCNIENILQIDQELTVIAMVTVAQFFDSQCITTLCLKKFLV